MFEVILNNDKKFKCDSNTTIFEAAKKSHFFLEHSCLTARCRSCVVKVLSGKTENIQEELVLTDKERNNNFVLSCNAKPLTDLKLDIEDIGDVTLYEKKIFPAKINKIEKVTKNVIKIVFRLPPTSNFKFNSGQYVNLIKGSINRSYSIANSSNHNNKLEFYIKKYENGLMSKYWFEEAKVNDLLRVEGPLGSFFLRESKYENIIFLATGTGIAPIKSILEKIKESAENKYQNKIFWIFVGARHKEDLLWKPNISNIRINYIPVLSRENNNWEGEKGYVQNIVLKKNIDLKNAQVYACGSNEMIQSAKEILLKNSLKENNFFSDAFVQTN
uniref:FAD-binding oxidoreductase n=1 Tax=uncultured Polaribacter sp. TaxID=174711 RepID=UPI002631CA4F|nr:FAD-binding oxidoreductase [uncultured Polaribacter sp.]